VVDSSVDESRIRAKSPLLFAKKAAAAKARAVAEKHKNSIVIGADTIVVLGRKILGKPKNKKDASAMLKSLSGTTHKVITGLAVFIPGKKMVSSYALTQVTMKKVSQRAIADYVNSGRPLDKAGAYGIQEIEDPFIEKIEGDYDNVVGLPVYKLLGILKLYLA
jgi:septum formation protein